MAIPAMGGNTIARSPASRSRMHPGDGPERGTRKSGGEHEQDSFCGGCYIALRWEFCKHLFHGFIELFGIFVRLVGKLLIGHTAPYQALRCGFVYVDDQGSYRNLLYHCGRHARPHPCHLQPPRPS